MKRIMLGLALAACADDPPPGPEDAPWQLVHADLPGALMSVWGSSATDVWAVGGDPDLGGPLGPLVLHFDGSTWERLETGTQGELWWVFGFAAGPVYMGGAGGTVLRYASGAFTPMSTPGTQTVFGIWGSSPAEVWAVGGEYGGARGAFAWRLEGDAWVNATGFPASLADTAAMWKVWGRSATDVWIVGTDGAVVYWNGQELAQSDVGGESLFTVHANAERFVAVGGFGGALLLENDGGAWRDASPAGASALVGVCLTAAGGIAVGWYGEIYERRGGVWESEPTGLQVDKTLHSVWIDESGGVWAVGGNVLTFPLSDGVLLHRGAPLPGGAIP